MCGHMYFSRQCRKTWWICPKTGSMIMVDGRQKDFLESCTTAITQPQCCIYRVIPRQQANGQVEQAALRGGNAQLKQMLDHFILPNLFFISGISPDNNFGQPNRGWVPTDCAWIWGVFKTGEPLDYLQFSWHPNLRLIGSFQHGSVMSAVHHCL